MATFRSLNEAHATFRFTVKIADVNQAAFLECKLPNLEVETEEVKEGGQNEFTHKLPVRLKTGTVTLRHGLIKGTELAEWYRESMSGDLAKALRQVMIIMYDSKGTPIMTWTLNDAYPVKWTGPALKSDDNAVAIEELELAYHGIEID